jgi:predicted GH43/DUF377 family glycosyl hydrolase
MSNITVQRTHHRLLPAAGRVLAKAYVPGEDVLAPGVSRAALLMARIVALSEEQVSTLLAKVLLEFSSRHRDFQGLLTKNFELVAHYIDPALSLSVERRLLIGAYFTHEYSVEAAALFNPSIVAAPSQANVEAGEQRFVMSLRAVGEGHLSSIEFRSGTLSVAGDLSFDPPSGYLVAGQRTAPTRYNKRKFSAKLIELGAGNELSAGVLARMSEYFTLVELEASLLALEEHGPPHAIWFETVKIIRVLASSNYVTTFPRESELSERVIFPAGPNETRGMEDARFVRFTDDDGSNKYYATYTAYDGFNILPQLIETQDFVTFSISTLNGEAAQNKGMALFPRRIQGQYVMLSRKDRENLHLATSSDVHIWNDVRELYKPSSPWELLQIGNCGSPLETEAGWLVLTHGVGPMRRYAISALLLDLDDPYKVIGKLREPLLEPDASERDGYVPNVVYTCGGLIHGEQLVLPYGFSDAGIAVALVCVPELLTAMLAAV